MLRTLGKYMGIIRKHANEFRAQFDEAMRDSELEALKKEVETIGKETEATIRSAEQTVQSEVDAARASVDAAMDDPAQKFAADANAPTISGRREPVAGGERRRCGGRDGAAQRCRPPARAGAGRGRDGGPSLRRAPDKSGA